LAWWWEHASNARLAGDGIDLWCISMVAGAVGEVGVDFPVAQGLPRPGCAACISCVFLRPSPTVWARSLGCGDESNRQAALSCDIGVPRAAVGLTVEDATMTEAVGTTVWRGRGAPLKRFLATETGSAAVLFGGVVAALIWANVSFASYESIWQMPLTIRIGAGGVSLSLRDWINSGLMAFFFFVVGLQARREFDLGELRERRRLALPVLAGIGGMVVPIAIFLGINAGAGSARAWAVALSTDTALALGILALSGRALPDRLRVFLLTVTLVDDLAALVIIVVFYRSSIQTPDLLVGVGLFAVILIVRALRVRVGMVYFVLAVGCWAAVLRSGIDPIVVGLAMGVITYAYPAPRSELERASSLFRQFREQPTPEFARVARTSVRLALSPNDRLQELYHPWVSFAIVPLFALANAGVPLSGLVVGRAFTSVITLGILLGYMIGKPVGIVSSTFLATVVSRGRIRPPVGWASVVGAGTVAGVGFTLPLLIAGLALRAEQLQQAKIGIIATMVTAAGLTWGLTRVTARLPRDRRGRALFGTTNVITDLAVPVDPDRDHIRGPAESLVTVVEYGDFECPYCGQAEPIVRELLAEHGEARYVWRHLPLTDVHPNAQLAAEAAEAAAVQGGFWAMHDLLISHQDALTQAHLIGYAGELDLDIDQFQRDLDEHRGANHVAADVESADLSSVGGTPTFFINERRHYGAYDIATLSAAIRNAKIQASISRGIAAGRR
jgi:Na+/H+ antiporter NhaA